MKSFSRPATLALAATALLTLATQGCRRDMAAVQQAPIVDGNDANDPANANMAQPLTAANYTGPVQYATPAQTAPRTRVLASTYADPGRQSAENYPPANGARNEAYNYNTQPPAAYQPTGTYTDNDENLYNDLLSPDTPIAQQPPPPLPEYEQPVAPGPDYLWTPGYWNYAPVNYGNPGGYYYVPGNWVSAPFVGALWTPGWWGYTGRGYGWHHGYWGRHVGYYGGVNYGFGFIGIGYQGGYWNNDHFFYNRDVNHVEPRVVNNYVYQRNVTVINNTYINNSRTSYYGGPGGLERRPVQAEFAAQRETHIAPLPAQIAEREQASANRQQFFAANSGRPAQLFAAHPVLVRNVAVPPQLARPQGQPNGPTQFNRGNGPGFNNNQRLPQQAAMQQQFNNQREQQQATNQQAQRFQQQQQGNAQHLNLQNRLDQQHFQQAQQQTAQQQQLGRQRDLAEQQRLQADGQRQAQQTALNQQRTRTGQTQAFDQQRVAEQQQRNLQLQQQMQQRQQGNQLRQQAEQQRLNTQQQREQFQQQHQQTDAQQQAQRAQAEQQRSLQAQQQFQQRAAQQQQNQQQLQQRAALSQQIQQRAAQQQQREQFQQQRSMQFQQQTQQRAAEQQVQRQQAQQQPRPQQQEQRTAPQAQPHPQAAAPQQHNEPPHNPRR